MKVRHRVLVMLVLLSVITYMDRVCIAVAGDQIQSELGISPEEWGWVLGVFALSYGLFEIPGGALGDRLGQRSVLTRIVLWWSAFTALTGAASGFVSLIVARFLFGAGEAGAYPNAAGSIGRWFPPAGRARAQGAVWAASRVGGALTPLILVPLTAAVGWRAAFGLFGAVGVVWAAAWYVWYRNDPAAHPAVTPDELAEINSHAPPAGHTGVPWGELLHSRRLWLVMAMYWCYCWGSFFYLSWYPKYLTKGRGLDQNELALLAPLAFVCGAVGNMIGGVLSDRLTRRYGPRVGRSGLGAACLLVSGLLILATASTTGKASGVVLLALGFGVMDCMLPAAWALCLDIGGRHAGVVSGAMNSAGQIGGFACSVLFGYLIVWTDNNYDAPLYVIAAMVLLSAGLFLRIDPTRPLLPADERKPEGNG